jgi:benzoylformate decarboxylase
MKGKEALLHQFQADGLHVIFGNPGSSEESLIEAIGRFDGIEYVLGLQEASVVAMADGWARVARKPAGVQVHSAVGLGNAMGVLYDAYRSHTPMVVMAGETYSDLQPFDGFLAGDLAETARPVTKWSSRVTHGSQLLRVLRRAIKVASTPPRGPVFLALPMDVLDEEIAADIGPTSLVSHRCTCSPSDAGEIARRLVAAKWPMLLIGDGVAEADARDELRRLAELLACPTWGVEFNDLSASYRDPLFLGMVGHSFGDTTRSIIKDADAILAVGTPLFPELFPSRSAYFKPGAVLMQIDEDPWEIAKNFNVAVGVQADPKSSLALVLAAVEQLMPADRSAIEARRAAVIDAKQAARDNAQRGYDSVPDTPASMAPGTLMRTLVEELPDSAIVYDESLTSTGALLHYLQPDRPGSYLLARGGCIGVGWPGAVGASFAEPGRTIVAPSGDGSAIFALQCLWTAAHYRRKVVFVVCNNHSYRILKINLLHYWRETASKAGPFPFMDLNGPRIDFTRLAEGFGVPATAAANAEELRRALRTAFEREGPSLIDAIVEGSVEAELQDILGNRPGVK